MAEKADAFLEKNVMKVLGNAGEMVKEGAKVSCQHRVESNPNALRHCNIPVTLQILQHKTNATLQHEN